MFEYSCLHFPTTTVPHPHLPPSTYAFHLNVEKASEELMWKNLYFFDSTKERTVWIYIHKPLILLSRLGLIEWIENTFTLKDLLLSNMSQEEKTAYTR